MNCTTPLEAPLVLLREKIFVKGATKAIESLGSAIEELPDRNLTLLKSTETLGKKVGRGNMVKNVHKKVELNRWSGKWKDGESVDE
ncbi:hypothetical protein BLS_009672 [Venturia inaequalis]|uniref:Uncharacterized protein n=1 Tax=Venturia inaequalis TaxID=5025 RepID=A0A8H3UZG1_VENIN|nr:hypothetical protein BLS_009672 [Venturia inaequalis]